MRGRLEDHQRVVAEGMLLDARHPRLGIHAHGQMRHALVLEIECDRLHIGKRPMELERRRTRQVGDHAIAHARNANGLAGVVQQLLGGHNRVTAALS